MKQTMLPPEREPAEPEVQGLPRSLEYSLLGLAGVLLLSGAVCGLYAAWDQLNDWARAGLLLLLPLVLLVYHLWRCRKSGLPMFSQSFAAFMAANVVALPGGVFLGVCVEPLCGTFGVLLYALALLWYGADYRLPTANSAACALAFAAALSIPFYLSPRMALSSILLILLGIAALVAAVIMHRKRATKLAQLRVLLRRRELSNSRAEADEEQPQA